MEFSVVAAHETGADLVATQDALVSWFVPVLLVGSLLFSVGTVLFAVAVARTATFGLVATAVVGGAVVVIGLARLVPVGVVQCYVLPAAALLALLPLAVAIRPGRRDARTR